MSAGSPPTLWWLLIVWLGPFTLLDSITSGYSVPCTSHATPAQPPSALRDLRVASSSKTAINSRQSPSASLRIGHTQPACARNRSLASTATTFSPSSSRIVFCTLANSSLRSTPLFTKMQVSRLPNRPCHQHRRHDESTPPTQPADRVPRPTCARIPSTVVWIKCAGVQSCSAPQISKQNSSAAPSQPRMRTSG
jgi:hypothetical protein